MTTSLRVRMEELASNPTNRSAIALCLDASSSMSGAPIAELNGGVRTLVQAIAAHKLARAGAEIGLVAFDTQARVVTDFQTVNHLSPPPTISAAGSTDLGGGVALTLERLQARIDEYRATAVQYYKPWLILMTDGGPTTDKHHEAAALCREMERRGELIVLPIGIGAAADMAVLATFSAKRPPLRLKGLKFEEFFEWVSAGIIRQSQSQPGDAVRLDTAGMKGWAEL